MSIVGGVLVASAPGAPAGAGEGGVCTISEYWKNTPELPDVSSCPVEREAAVRSFAWGCFRYFCGAHPLRRAIAYGSEKLGAAISTSSCPALCRASTSWFPREKDVDGRDKPGHDEFVEGSSAYAIALPAAGSSATVTRSYAGRARCDICGSGYRVPIGSLYWPERCGRRGLTAGPRMKDTR